MALRQRRSLQRAEEALPLEEVLEPYDDQQSYMNAFQYDDSVAYEEPAREQQYPQAEYPHYPESGYADYLPQEAYEDDEEPELRFGVAAHVFDAIASLVGVFVILVLVAMLLTLVDWLRTDILHSFVMLQSGIS
ncbi:MAG: hypothetical protein E7323_07210 [Clostridiales bacterium]|nr:hypothetical protein [Clostridiales bacterium]